MVCDCMVMPPQGFEIWIAMKMEAFYATCDPCPLRLEIRASTTIRAALTKHGRAMQNPGISEQRLFMLPFGSLGTHTNIHTPRRQTSGSIDG